MTFSRARRYSVLWLTGSRSHGVKYNKSPKKSQKYVRLGKTCSFYWDWRKRKCVKEMVACIWSGCLPTRIDAQPFLPCGLFPRLAIFHIARAFFRVTFDELRKNRDRDRDRLFVFDLKVTPWYYKVWFSFSFTRMKDPPINKLTPVGNVPHLLRVWFLT